MFNYISYFSTIEYRVDEALIALAIITAIQLCMVIFSTILRQAISPLPIFNIILTPLCGFFSVKLNKDNRSSFALIIRGVIVGLLCLCGAFAFLWCVPYVMQLLNMTTWTNIVLLCLVLSPVYPMYMVFSLTSKTPPQKTLYYLAHAIHQNMVHDDDHGIKRNGFRLLALSITDWLITPLVLYVLFGSVCVYVYASISTLIHLNKNTQKAEPFLSLFLIIKTIVDTGMNLIFFLVAIVAAAITTKGRPLQAIKAFQSPTNPLAAYAYALDIALGGASQDRHGNTRANPWVGSSKATAKIINGDVHRGVLMQLVMILIIIAIGLGLYLYGFA